MNEIDITVALAKIEQAIAAQENLRGVLPDEQIEVTLASLRQKKAETEPLLTEAARASDWAEVRGSGAVAQGEGATVVGERGVNA